jgi:acid phosphatase (class A)
VRSRSSVVWVCVGVLLGVGAMSAQAPVLDGPNSGMIAARAAAYALDPAVDLVVRLIAAPPKDGSAQQKADLAELHRIEATRTDDQARAAKADEQNESMFLYRTVLGAKFDAASLPLTSKLGDRIKAEQSAAGAPLKVAFARIRPYTTDKTLHPVCDLTTKPNSYPSGHALTGYLEGLTLAEMLPEQRDAILARTDDYAHNRLVCGVHYPSDVEASRRVAYAVFGEMLASPEFEHDLAAARSELRAALGM